MIRNYLKIAVRSLTRYKGFAAINILGLAVGMACSMFILLWIQDELSYDRFNENIETLYRVEEDQTYSGEIFHVTVTPYPPGPVFKEEIPELLNATRIDWLGTRLVRQDDRVFYENGIAATDPSTFEMFTFPFIEGDPGTALDDPQSIILSEEIAEKFFSDESPIGKTVTIDNNYVMTVTGVIENVPQTSTIDFDMLVPFEFLRALGVYSDSWSMNTIFTFVQIRPGASVATVNAKLNEVMEANADDPPEFMAMPLADVHLYGYFGFGRPMGNIKYIYVFAAIAIFVLLIACINFMNLSTARSARRSKEIGLRKTVGAGRWNVARQFLGETVFLAMIALLFAVILVALFLEPSNALTGKDLTLGTLLKGRFLLGVVGITLITGLFAGSYPAVILSAFRPTDSLKGGSGSAPRNNVFRRTLVVIQFGLSIFLIIGTAIVYQQLTFMRDKDLGYNQDHLLTIRMREEVRSSFATLKSGWISDPRIRAVTATAHRPSNIGSNSGGADWAGKDPEQNVLIGFSFVDYDYVESLQITLLEGRDFSEDYPSDLASDTTGAWLINRATANLVGMETVIGEELSFLGVSGPIIGVMENFNYNSLRIGIEPLALALLPRRVSYAVLRIDPVDISGALESVEETWSRILPSFPLEYHFLDEDFDRMYRAEERMGELLTYFALIAVLIACLGLVGLAAFTAEQRRKEISIRKVLGATHGGISFLLCREFLVLVLISNVIAWPAAYFASDGWLQSFAYRVDVGVMIFVLTGLMATALALLTVSYQAIRAALANPVDALKYE